jgi:hypothetical protein
MGVQSVLLKGIAPITATSQLTRYGLLVCSGQAIAQCNGATGTSGESERESLADPYLSGRAPEFSFYNFGMQREITNSLVVTVNYVGSQSHFIAGAASIRGLYAGRLIRSGSPWARI